MCNRCINPEIFLKRCQEGDYGAFECYILSGNEETYEIYFSAGVDVKQVTRMMPSDLNGNVKDESGNYIGYVADSTFHGLFADIADTANK